MSDKNMNEDAAKVAVAPLKLLASMVVEIPDDVQDSDDYVRTKVSEKVAAMTTSKEIKKILFDFSQKLSEALEITVLTLPMGFFPENNEKDAQIVQSFMDDFFKSIGEEAQNGSGSTSNE